MLIRFSIENFLSFNDRQTFSMIAGRERNNRSHIIPKLSKSDVDLLKLGVIYGPNASGKSNLIKAIDFGRKLVLNGTPADSIIQFKNFKLHQNSINSPSRIEFEIKHKNKSYAYGFVFNNKNIIEEWLYSINKNSEKLIFERKDISKFNIEPLFSKNSISKEKQFLEFISKSTPDNQLFLTEIRIRKVKDNVSDIEDLLNVIDWFQNSLTVVYPDSKFQGIEFELEHNKELKFIFEDLLKYFDTGISGIQLTEIDFDKAKIPSPIKDSIKANLLKDKSEKTNLFLDNLEENIRFIFFKENNEVKVKKMMTEHTVYGGNTHRIPFDLNEESDGTQRIMDFVPLLIDLFKGDNVYIVDEMERSLHPNLVYDLIDLFIKKSTNINSQLILASHEASLFDKHLLRKDEIWFTNKSEFGATNLYSLQDYNVSIDDKSRKDYLLGRFKAVPRLGNRSSISFIEGIKDAKRKN